MPETSGDRPGSPAESSGRPTRHGVVSAASLARRLLAGNDERVRHSAAVAERATFLGAALDRDDQVLLVTAAWLHDVGYASKLRVTGFHPVDGARYLRSAGWPHAVCDLVAHHSGSRYVAAARGLEAELTEFGYDEGPVSDALTVADQTIGPNGRSMTIDERMADMLGRHGPDSPNARAHAVRERFLRAAALRVAARLEVAGIGRDRHQIMTPTAGSDLDQGD